MIFGSNCFFLRPETFEDIRISSLNNRLVIKTAIFFLEQLFMNILVKSDRERRSPSDDSSKDDSTVEAETLVSGIEFTICCDDATVWCEVAANDSSPPNDAGTPVCVYCPPKDCRIGTLVAEVDGSVWGETAKSNASSSPKTPAEIDGIWCEANVGDTFKGI